MLHRPVLLQEVLQYLNPKSNENFIDATVGEGGHAKVILEKTAPQGILIGVDKDVDEIRRARKELSQFGKRVILFHDSFAQLCFILSKKEELAGLSWQGILFDLGWSQAQIDLSGRGFSFMRDEELDMRYNEKSKVKNQKLKVLTAGEIVNRWSKEELEKILKEYGEERFARSIVNGILNARRQKQITATFQLVDIIRKATPTWYHYRRIHPATKTFQALRIAVNNEWEELKKGLDDAVSIARNKGKIGVISFHSGEDRIVKQKFQEFEKRKLGNIITKKPITASREEVIRNFRARSAKLRIFQKI